MLPSRKTNMPIEIQGKKDSIGLKDYRVQGFVSAFIVRTKWDSSCFGMLHFGKGHQEFRFNGTNKKSSNNVYIGMLFPWFPAPPDMIFTFLGIGVTCVKDHSEALLPAIREKKLGCHGAMDEKLNHPQLRISGVELN